MKTIKSILLGAAALFMMGTATTSCADKLDLGPIDYFGSGSYWKTEAHARSYVYGLHSHLRDLGWRHNIVFSEVRGGTYNETMLSYDDTSLSDGNLILNNFDADHTGVSNFGDYYGRITNCNLMIARVNQADYMTDDAKAGYLAIAHGLRAFLYFDLYRTYGGVPLRLDVAVIDGELDPTKLYMERATASQTMAQIKDDLAKSLQYFGSANNFGMGKQFWNKAATECLMAEVYLWNAKVPTGDQAAVPADATVAKQHLNNVLNNYGLSLLPNFASNFDAKAKGGAETIFAIRYAENEATNSNGSFTYSTTTGQAWKNLYQPNGVDLFGDPLGLASTGGYVCRHEYKKSMYTQFDAEDTRRDATFIPAYRKNEDGSLTLHGTCCSKNVGYINSTGSRVMCGDYILYRLAWVHLTLAEIANFEGDNAGVKRHMDIVRARAYGANWDANRYGYTPGDFTQNELAILKEKDKEFIQEGQRWWDVRRMTKTKGGDALVFCIEAAIERTTPILNKATEAHKVLWPLDKTLLNNDTALEQNPGY